MGFFFSYVGGGMNTFYVSSFANVLLVLIGVFIGICGYFRASGGFEMAPGVGIASRPSLIANVAVAVGFGIALIFGFRLFT